MDHFHYYFYEDKETLILLKQILKQVNILNKNIMAQSQEIEKLNLKIDELQETTDTMQQNVANSVAELLAEIQALKDAATAGSITPAEVLAAIGRIDTVIEDIKTTNKLPDPEEV